MRRGKYQSKRKCPWAVWVLILIAVLSLSTGTAFAYLRASTGPVTNTFSADVAPNPVIREDVNGNVKSNVSVVVNADADEDADAEEKKLDYAVYVRAAIVFTWQDENSKVLAQAPVKGTDYNILLNTTDWFEKDGFYYYRYPISSTADTNAVTGVLINSCSPIVTKTDYSLHVEIITQTIQALGTTDDNNTPAVTDAWKVTVDANGNLTAG